MPPQASYENLTPTKARDTRQPIRWSTATKLSIYTFCAREGLSHHALCPILVTRLIKDILHWSPHDKDLYSALVTRVMRFICTHVTPAKLSPALTETAIAISPSQNWKASWRKFTERWFEEPGFLVKFGTGEPEGEDGDGGEMREEVRREDCTEKACVQQVISMWDGGQDKVVEVCSGGGDGDGSGSETIDLTPSGQRSCSVASGNLAPPVSPPSTPAPSGRRSHSASSTSTAVNSHHPMLLDEPVTPQFDNADPRHQRQPQQHPQPTTPSNIHPILRSLACAVANITGTYDFTSALNWILHDPFAPDELAAGLAAVHTAKRREVELETLRQSAHIQPDQMRDAEALVCGLRRDGVAKDDHIRSLSVALEHSQSQASQLGSEVEAMRQANVQGEAELARLRELCENKGREVEILGEALETAQGEARKRGQACVAGATELEGLERRVGELEGRLKEREEVVVALERALAKGANTERALFGGVCPKPHHSKAAPKPQQGANSVVRTSEGDKGLLASRWASAGVSESKSEAAQPPTSAPQQPRQHQHPQPTTDAVMQDLAPQQQQSHPRTPPASPKPHLSLQHRGSQSTSSLTSPTSPVSQTVLLEYHHGSQRTTSPTSLDPQKPLPEINHHYSQPTPLHLPISTPPTTPLNNRQALYASLEADSDDDLDSSNKNNHTPGDSVAGLGYEEPPDQWEAGFDDWR